MAKIKELLAGREKLARYDELTEFKRFFENPHYLCTLEVKGSLLGVVHEYGIPCRIKEIIANALDAEIAKLDEE